MKYIFRCTECGGYFICHRKHKYKFDCCDIEEHSCVCDKCWIDPTEKCGCKKANNKELIALLL